MRMKLTPCTWRGEGLHVRTHGTKRVHLLLLARVLQALRPETVLEVGAGNGLNVLVLAALFPDIRFTSVELTEAGVAKARAAQVEPTRSEEHTSELQSLMRISYAVFCLKKKKNK